MPFLHETEIRLRARQRAKLEGLSVEDSLASTSRQYASSYDIFLSQTIHDAEIVLGVYDLLAKMGYSVFCDWIAQPEQHRGEVTPANAAFIRYIMGLSESFLFLDTEKADQSKWMCWELGWFDGQNGRVAILPVLSDGQNYYRGREFLGLYPYIELDDEGSLRIVRPPAVGPRGIMIFESPNTRSFARWQKESSDFMRPRAI
ncbi:MAG: toll-Interleukin receptor [Pseudomonadota bacterium]